MLPNTFTGVISAASHILWQNFLDIQDGAFYTSPHKKEVLINYSNNPYTFVSACDMPYLSKEFIGYLTAQAGKHDVTVPELTEGYQPLHAIYSRNCLPSIKRLLLMDKLKITGFYRDMRVLSITEEQIQPFNSDGRLFQNLNTPEDVENIQGSRFTV